MEKKLKKRAMTSAERGRAYRERKKGSAPAERLLFRFAKKKEGYGKADS